MSMVSRAMRRRLSGLETWPRVRMLCSRSASLTMQHAQVVRHREQQLAEVLRFAGALRRTARVRGIVSLVTPSTSWAISLTEEQLVDPDRGWRRCPRRCRAAAPSRSRRCPASAWSGCRRLPADGRSRDRRRPGSGCRAPSWRRRRRGSGALRRPPDRMWPAAVSSFFRV